MKPFIFMLAIFSLVFLCPFQSVYAEEKIPMPEGIDYEVNGQQGIFFTLEEYKQIALVYNAYVNNLDKIQFINTKYELMLDIEKNYDLRVKNCQSHISILEYDLDFQKARVKELRSTIKSINRNSKLQAILHWSLIGILAAADLVLVVHDSTD